MQKGKAANGWIEGGTEEAVDRAGVDRKEGILKPNTMKFLFIVFIIALVGCTSSEDFDKGKRILENQGFTNVVNTGYQTWCCDDKETYSTGFRAIDKAGNTVEGCFCSAAFKGVTIRFK